MSITLIILLCGICLTGSSGCGDDSSRATETGNPVESESVSTPPYFFGFPASILADALCFKLNECFPDLAEDTCKSRIAESETIGVAFGIEEGMFESFQEAIEASEEGELPFDDVALDQCVKDITALECNDESVTSFDNTDFLNLENLIPAENCPYVFSG